MLQQMTLKGRLITLTVLVTVLVCILGGLSIYDERSAMLQDRHDKVRNLTESAVGLITSFEQMAATGKMSEAAAKEAAAKALMTLRYDEKEYFFAFDSSLVYVAHGVKPAAIGKDLHNIKDGNGENMGALFDAALRDGGGKGFISYVWEKPGFDTPQPKVSYVATTAGWKWVVGTGIYLDDVSAAVHAMVYRVLAMIGLVVVLVLLLGLSIGRSIVRQLGGEPVKTLEVVKRIADSQLDEDVPVRAGDLDSLLAAVARMQSQLRTLVQDIVASSGQLHGMSDQVTQSAHAVSEGSDAQSLAASAMAASVEELTVSVNHIADSAEEARKLSREAGDLSLQGREVIGRAVTEIQRINESVDLTSASIGELTDKTQTISTIMQVIKDIADQTNLLALNAAIEAARAGEMGRGFAVVADEVRKLSERTALATQEIAGMISEIQSKSAASHHSMEEAVGRVKNGLALAEEAGSAIGRIEESARAVVQVVNAISGALQEQSQASNDIAQQVERIAQSSASNAEASATTAQAVREMRGVSEQLRSLVARFRL